MYVRIKQKKFACNHSKASAFFTTCLCFLDLCIELALSRNPANNSFLLYFSSHVSLFVLAYEYVLIKAVSQYTRWKNCLRSPRDFSFIISQPTATEHSLPLVTDAENLAEAFIAKKRFIRCLANERIRGAWYSCNNIEINRDTDATRWRRQQCHSHRATLCRSSVCTFASTSPLYVSVREAQHT